MALFGVRSLRVLLARLGRRFAPRRSLAAIPGTAALPSTSSPIRITSPMCLPALRPRKPRRSSAPASPPTRGSRKPKRRPGEWIAISGVGGLGHLAIQYAKGMGLLVCAIDIDDGKLAHAKRLGADLVVNAKAGDPAAAVKKETGGGAHGVLITAPSLIAFKQGVGMTRKRGTCVLVGLPPGEFPVPLFDVVANCITIRGSFVGTRQDMAEALAFAAEGKVKADIELQPLSSINQIFDRLEHGDVPSRVVLEFASERQVHPDVSNFKEDDRFVLASTGAK